MKTLVYMHLLKLTNLKYFRIKRCAFVGIIIAIFFVILFQKQASWNNVNDHTAIGRSIINTLTLWVAVALFFIMPYFAFKIFLDEDQKMTDLLIVTNNAPSIIFSRFLAMYLNIFLYGLTIFPITILCFSLGGISATDICFRYMYFFLMTFLSLGLCLHIHSTQANSSRTFFETLSFHFFIFSFLLIFFLMLRAGFLASSSLNSHLFAEMMSMLLLMSISLCIFYCSWHNLKAKINNKLECTPQITPITIETKKTLKAVKNKRKRKLLHDNKKIIRWKDEIFSSNQLIRAASFFFSFLIFYFFIISFLVQEYFFHPGLLEINIIGLILLVFINSIYLFSKEDKCIELLLLTRVRPKDIVNQKLSILRRNVRSIIFNTIILFLSIFLSSSDSTINIELKYLSCIEFMSGLCIIFFAIFLNSRKSKIIFNVLLTILFSCILFYIQTILIPKNALNDLNFFIKIATYFGFLFAVSCLFYKLTIKQIIKNVFKN